MSGFWDDLPDRTKAIDGWAIRCPWCRQEAGQTRVSLEDIFMAWEAGTALASGNQLWRGRRFDTGIPADCPHCAKPFLVRLVRPEPGEGRHMVAACARTPTDAAFLSGSQSSNNKGGETNG